MRPVTSFHVLLLVTRQGGTLCLFSVLQSHVTVWVPKSHTNCQSHMSWSREQSIQIIFFDRWYMTIENHWNQWSNDPKTIENPLMSMARVPTNFNCDGFLKNYWKLQSSPKSLKFSMVKASHCHRYCNCHWDHHHHLPQWPLVTHEAGGTSDQGVAWQGTWWVTPSQVPQLTLTGHMVAHSILTKVVPANRHLKLLHLTLSGFHISSPPPPLPIQEKATVWWKCEGVLETALLGLSCLPAVFSVRS